MSQWVGMLGDMTTDYTPAHAGIACWHCVHFDGFIARGVHSRCSRPLSCRVQADPAHGCAFWERVPGVDDEPGPPQGAYIRSPWAPLQSTQRGPAGPTPQPVAWTP